MRKTASILLACALMLLAGVPSVRAMGPLDVELEAGGWFSELSGDVRSGGSDLDVEQDLGMSDNTAAMVRARLGTPLGNFYAGYTPLEYDGSSTSGGIDFGGITVPPGQAVSSTVDIDTYDIGWTFTLLDLPAVDLELGADLKFADGSVSVSNPAAGTGRADVSVPIPLAKGVVRVDLPFVSAELDAMGIAYGGDHMFDLLAQLKLSPLPFFYLAGGYRYMDFDLEDGGDRAAVTASGPFAALGFSF